MPYGYEQHSRDRGWWIEGGRGHWKVFVKWRHVATFARREDARRDIRARKPE